MVRDDAAQARAAARALTQAERVAIAMPCLCEFVWVLRKGGWPVDARYRCSPARAGCRRQCPSESRRRGDGCRDIGSRRRLRGWSIAHEGQWLGGETFVSLDKQAVAVLAAAGQPARLL